MTVQPYRAALSWFFGLTLACSCLPIAHATEDPPSKTAENSELEAGDESTTEAATEDDEIRSQAIAIFNEGVAALEADDMVTALDRFHEAATVDPDFADAARAVAAIAMELKEFDKAADAAENLVRLQPDNADAIGTAYFAELMLADIDRLIPSAKRLADVNPEVVSNEMVQHAQVLFDGNELDGSRRLLEVIIEREPDLAPAFFQLGLTCNMSGETDCAVDALTRFLELAPESPDAATARSLLDYLE